MDGELEVLLAEARRGNRAAFARFVRATNAEVWSFCARVAGRDEADDAAQETYVGLWRSLPSFRGQCSARTWLFQIARRTAWRSRRRREQWERLSLETPAPNRSELGPGPEMEEALGQLDLARRSAFVLTQLYGFTYAEAAVICECPVGTIRSRVARARELLVRADAVPAHQSEAG